MAVTRALCRLLAPRDPAPPRRADRAREDALRYLAEHRREVDRQLEERRSRGG